MSDDLSKKKPQDAGKINIHESWELEYWSNHFSIPKEKIIHAVNAVGVSVESVRKYFQK